MATRIGAPEVLARRTGPCAYGCDRQIVKDEDFITKVDGKGWMHAFCAADYRRNRELFLELNREDGDA